MLAGLTGEAAPAGLGVGAADACGPGGEPVQAVTHSAANALNHSRRTPVDTTGGAENSRGTPAWQKAMYPGRSGRLIGRWEARSCARHSSSPRRRWRPAERLA